MKIFSRTLLLFFSYLAVIISSGCATRGITQFPHWQNQHFRYIDPLDSTDPNSDLIAVETQFVRPSLLTSQQQLFLRLDFLSRSVDTSDSILIFFDTAPGGLNQHPLLGKMDISWEFYLVIHSNQIYILDQDNQPLPGFQTVIFQQADQDYLEISIRTLKENIYIPDNTLIQIYSITTTNQSVLDKSDPICLSSLPLAPVKVMMAFWNTYQVTTPLQALRRWDGAHTGPLGRRHGLSNLLRTAQAQGIPIILLDLKTPISLSALDFSSKLEILLPLASVNSIILPDNIPLYGIDNLTDAKVTEIFYENVVQDFGFSKSPFLFIPKFTPSFHNGYLQNHSFLFTLSNDLHSYVHSRKYGDKWILEIPDGIASAQYQPDENGLSIALKKELVEAIIAENRGNPQLIAIGGDLPHSTWGDSQIAHAAFAELSQIPWVHIENPQDVLAWRIPSPPNIPNEIIVSNENQIGLNPLPPLKTPRLAFLRESFLKTLFPINPPPKYSELRKSIVAIFPAYPFVDDWFRQPRSISECPVDISGDGQADCILANDLLFLWIDSSNGGIIFLFYRAGEQLHQVISPGFTLASGLTDPSQWDFSQGIYAEKRVDTAALHDKSPYSDFGIGKGTMWFNYQIRQSVNINNQIDDKIVRLRNNQIEVVYRDSARSNLIIPLNLDPWGRFEVDWADNYKICTEYNPAATVNNLCWSYHPSKTYADLSVRVSAQALPNDAKVSTHPIILSIDTFKDTINRFSHTEDPNQDKPIGNFLPFPMSLIRVLSPNPVSLLITITVSING